MKKPRPRGEAGYTLTEVLVAVSILSVAIIVIVGAMSDGILASRVHRDIVTSDAVARSYADQIIAGPYVACATSASYPVSTVPSGFTAQIISVKYWNNAAAANSTATFGTTCPSPDAGMQQITVQVNRTGGAGFQTVQLVKRQS